MAETSQGGIKGRIERARARFPWFDHVMSMNEHYGSIEGNILAGAVTYFGFLSFFPVLAIAFAVIGYVSVTYPDARDHLVTAIEQVFPGIVSETGEPGTISLTQIEDAKAAAGIIGFATLLYSGLGWLSGLRQALENAFEVPRREQPSFVIGKAFDLLTLATIGAIMIVSVGLAGLVKGAADEILDAIGLSGTAVGEPLIWAIGIVLGVASSTLLFFVMFKILGRPNLPFRLVVNGAMFGAIGFEALKLIVVNILGGVGGSPFAPLAIAITLVVWINYFSRLVIYGASWAMTSRRSTASARASTRSEAAVAATDHALLSGGLVTTTGTDAAPAEAEPVHGRFDAGSAIFGAAAGFVVAMLFGRRP